MNKTLNTCIISSMLTIYLCSCVDTTTRYSEKCGKYTVLKNQNLLFDTVYVFDPTELKEKRYVNKKYIDRIFRIICSDTSIDNSLIYEIGTFDNESGNFLLSEIKVEYYPYK